MHGFTSHHFQSTFLALTFCDSERFTSLAYAYDVGNRSSVSMRVTRRHLHAQHPSLHTANDHS
jgi:hypothetical protein